MPRKKAETAATSKTAASSKEKATKTKTSASKAAEATTAEKKSRKAPCKTTVCVEMSGLSVSVNEIQNAVKKAVKEKGLDASEVKIYINAAEQAAYYTVDGEGGEESKVDLKEL